MSSSRRGIPQRHCESLWGLTTAWKPTTRSCSCRGTVVSSDQQFLVRRTGWGQTEGGETDEQRTDSNLRRLATTPRGERYSNLHRPRFAVGHLAATTATAEAAELLAYLVVVHFVDERAKNGANTRREVKRVRFTRRNGSFETMLGDCAA